MRYYIANAILERLNRRKYLILGNHDYYAANKQFDPSHFEWITHYREINDNNRKVILCHYPVMCYNGQYRRNAKRRAAMKREDYDLEDQQSDVIHDAGDE